MLPVIPVSDRFSGFSAPAVECALLLKGKENVTEIEFLRVAFGCSCGQCIEGFLSPRMSFALKCAAEQIYDMLEDDFESIDGADFVSLHDIFLKYLTDSIRDNLKTNNSMRQGYTNLCKHTATCLEKNCIPNEQNMLALSHHENEWPPNCKNLLKRGGTVGMAVSTIIHTAIDWDELAGDGLHRKVMSEEIEKLPVCRNDHEFLFVKGMCGYSKYIPVDSLRFRNGF